MDSQIVHGHAFDCAYEVENRRAIYPRILLDSSLRLSGPANRSYWWQTYVSDDGDIPPTEWRDPSRYHNYFCDQNGLLYDAASYKVDDELLGPSALEQEEEYRQPTLGT